MVATLQDEEQLVAELEQLGVRYLSRQNTAVAARMHAPQELLSELVRQPSSRVRVALIALLLVHPDYAEFVPAALDRLTSREAGTMKFLYSAAVCLQHRYMDALRAFLGTNWRWLPDLFADELKLGGDTPAARLDALGRLHAQWVGMQLNWAGTYDSAARQLLLRLELERTWNL